MSRIVQSFLMGAMAACAFSFTAAAHADIPFGYTDSQDWDQRPYRHHNPAPRYEDPYNDYQRMQQAIGLCEKAGGKPLPGLSSGYPAIPAVTWLYA